MWEGKNGTWLEPEERCGPQGGKRRRCRAINVETGKPITVRCGLPDTVFSVPAIGGWVGVEDGEFQFHPDTVNKTTWMEENYGSKILQQ